MKYLFAIYFIFSFGILSVKGQWSIKGDSSDKKSSWNLLQKFTPEAWDASNFATAEEMKWFNDARYGMFIHFGLSTYIGKDLSWDVCYTRKTPDKGHGQIADSIWVKYPEHLVFNDFDAKKWVEIAKNAGMKYIVTVAKHHDGFHMWDTKYSDFKVTNTPFGRDLLKEIAEACHEAGVKFGIYYSQRDWYHPFYEPVDTSLVDIISEPPYYKAKLGVKEVKPGPNHQKYIDYQFNVIKELCTNYGKVDIFWFDACWWGGMFTAEMWESEKLTRMIRELQPGIIINNRASVPGDFDTPEQKIGMHQFRPWESCITLCGSWSWSDTPTKSKKDIINILTATACGNGNMLLSWGPKWEGEFDPVQVKRLQEVGDWLKLYGHTIYNTKGGPWYPEEFGGSTYRGNKAFVHITKKVTKELQLPKTQNKLININVLTGGEADFTQKDNTIIIDLQKVNTDRESIILELTFEDEITSMVNEKRTKSKFEDPLFGEVISGQARLKLSSQSTEDNPKHHNLLFRTALFNSPFAFHTKQEKESFALIDLGKLYSVCGIDIYNEKWYHGEPGTFEVQISIDGAEWKKVESDQSSFKHWEVTVAEFNAGIQLPGVQARFIKIVLRAKTKSSLHLKKIQVYGKIN